MSSSNNIISKEKIIISHRNILTDKEIGKILGYFCYNHPSWSNVKKERFGIHIFAEHNENNEIIHQLFAMSCENKLITKNNVKLFIIYLKKLENCYNNILKKLEINNFTITLKISLDIVLKEIDDIIVDASTKLSLKELLDYKMNNKKITTEYTDYYTFK